MYPMNLQQFSSPEQLERNSFLWSEVRLVIAAVALFLGGVPPAIYFIDNSGLIWSLLKICWIISGAASVYLAYRWNKGGQTVFGGKDQKDLAAFAVSVVSGINLGLAGLLGNNIGMSIASGGAVFTVVGLLYLVCAYHLYQRWQAHGSRVF